MILFENRQLSLSEEKRRLQIILHEYQTQFLADTGRAAQSPTDWEPVKKEYKQYKVDFLILNAVYKKAIRSIKEGWKISLNIIQQRRL